MHSRGDMQMRLILSRKGMDSGRTGDKKNNCKTRTAGIPSPIFSTNDRLNDRPMVSLPIGSDWGDSYMNDLRLDGRNLGAMVNALSNGRLSPEMRVHRDPDLYRTLIKRDRNWRPAFGTANGGVTTLEKHAIQKGDLFLFFGWFREVERTSGRFEWQYVRGARDLHVIFGWLQVGDIIRLPDKDGMKSDEDILKDTRRKYPWLQKHDHFCRCNPKEGLKKNVIYVAADRLQFGERVFKIPGGGAFSHFSDDLQLTARQRKRSVWRLPACFWSQQRTGRLTSHEDAKRWKQDGTSVILQSVARGQDFVLDCDQHPGVEEWALRLIKDNAGNAH